MTHEQPWPAICKLIQHICCASICWYHCLILTVLNSQPSDKRYCMLAVVRQCTVSDGCDCHCTAPARKKSKRQPWTTDEQAAVKRHFATHLRLHKVPLKHECVKCKDSEQCLSSRDWKSIKYFVHTTIRNNKRVLWKWLMLHWLYAYLVKLAWVV